MSIFKNVPSGKTSSDQFDKAIEKNPNLLKRIDPIRSMVDKELQIMTEEFVDGKAFEREKAVVNQYREWLDDPEIDHEDVAELNNLAKTLVQKYQRKEGQTIYFAFRNKPMMITSVGTIELVHKYVDRLESAIYDVYNQSFWSYTKLAFRNLFIGRSYGKKEKKSTTTAK